MNASLWQNKLLILCANNTSIMRFVCTQINTPLHILKLVFSYSLQEYYLLKILLEFQEKRMNYISPELERDKKQD
jgi:hypothetical protein